MTVSVSMTFVCKHSVLLGFVLQNDYDETIGPVWRFSIFAPMSALVTVLEVRWACFGCVVGSQITTTDSGWFHILEVGNARADSRAVASEVRGMAVPCYA